jgi:hypothetical protein
MIMNDDKKNRATIIVRKISGNMEPVQNAERAEINEMGDEVDNSIGLMSAAEDMMSAVQSKDAKALKNALKSFIDMCESSDDQEEKE